MSRSTEIEILRAEGDMLRRRLLENGRITSFVNSRNAELVRTARLAGDELRALQQRERKRSRETFRNAAGLTCLVAFVAFWFGVAGVELAQAFAR